MLVPIACLGGWGLGPPCFIVASLWGVAWFSRSDAKHFSALSVALHVVAEVDARFLFSFVCQCDRTVSSCCFLSACRGPLCARVAGDLVRHVSLWLRD